MWLIIFTVAILGGIVAALYMARKIENTGIFGMIGSKPVVKLLSLLSVIVIAAVICFILDFTNTVIIFIHIALFLLLGDLVRAVICKVSSYTPNVQTVSLTALLACIIYLGVGWFLMHGMWETDYSLHTDKTVNKLRIAHIADSHVGCGFSGQGFGERLARIEACEPDILVITGDFVDDSTGREDMETACAALGQFKTKYGIYYCIGNHDMGYYGSAARGYSGEELLDELRENGVTVLCDETVMVNDTYYIIGRYDADYGVYAGGTSGAARASIGDLTAGLDKSKYMIVLDHQPTDYDEEEAAQVDLVLSGHTHGGQLFPLQYIMPYISQNDKVRGYERRGETDFIVTDGISDWAIKFKTGCKSEYNIIDIEY